MPFLRTDVRSHFRAPCALSKLAAFEIGWKSLSKLAAAFEIGCAHFSKPAAHCAQPISKAFHAQPISKAPSEDVVRAQFF